MSKILCPDCGLVMIDPRKHPCPKKGGLVGLAPEATYGPKSVSGGFSELKPIGFIDPRPDPYQFFVDPAFEPGTKHTIVSTPYPSIHGEDILKELMKEKNLFSILPKIPINYKPKFIHEFDWIYFAFGFYTRDRPLFPLIKIWANPLPQDIPWDTPPRKSRKYVEKDLERFLLFATPTVHGSTVIKAFLKLMKRYTDFCGCDVGEECLPHQLMHVWRYYDVG